jgi:dipeptidyl-peptidase 4
MMDSLHAFPRRSAMTRRFTLGVPRSFTSIVSPHGPVVFFLRSKTGDDPLNQLVMITPHDGNERVLVDPHDFTIDDSAMTQEERAQRERAREQAGGVTAFDVNRDGTRIVFTLGGELFTLDAPFTTVSAHQVSGAFDARIAPDGSRIAFHRNGDVAVLACDTSTTTVVCEADDTIVFGRAEFIAAEEMGRMRGMWWLPDSRTLLVTAVDESGVDVWHISDPADPHAPSRPVRYPAAGTTNATVTLRLVDVVTGTHTPVGWDDRYPYLARVTVHASKTVLLCQSRDQTRAALYQLDTATGATTVLHEIVNEPWVELISGTPYVHNGDVITVEDHRYASGAMVRAVCVNGVPISPDTLYVRDVVAVSDTDVTVHASMADATVIAPYVVFRDGTTRARAVTVSSADSAGIHHLVAPRSSDGVWVHSVTTMASVTPTVFFTASRDDMTRPIPVRVTAEDPGFLPQVTFLTLGEKRLSAALILPQGATADDLFPVLLDPYGGPHAQRVLAHPGMFLSSAWFAAQGFAVLIIDGQGTPGREPAFEYAIAGNFACTLDDQIDGLFAAKDHEPRLDLTRVAIRGWSFGGYLAALAVLRRPDVFHAAIAGAPVTHWQWYDTHYTERYLGRPQENPEAYTASNLLSETMALTQAAPWDEPTDPKLLLIHGLADDNVVAAHTLALSSALLAENRTHQVLPLSGVTHMTPQEQVAEALLLQQARFLREALCE